MLQTSHHREGGMVEEFNPQPIVLVAAVTAVAALYFFFLAFAQFGFLQRVQASAPGQVGLVRGVTALMAFSGVAASVYAAWSYIENHVRRNLMAAFSLCVLAAGASLLGVRLFWLFLVALLTGAGIGLGTVTLASSLRRVTGGRRLGSCLGIGTGLAYGMVNLPTVIRSGPTGLAVFSLVAACVGLLAVQLLELRAPQHRPAGADYQRPGIAAWVGVFLALVWLDSAAFFIIQHNPERWSVSWGSDRALYANAGVHLLAALLAGHALDRRWVGRSILAASGLLVVACLLTRREDIDPAAGSLLYVGGVSIYSTTLIFYPARSGRPVVAALVYALAGWGGSALGIGMAGNLHEIPLPMILGAGCLAGFAMLLRGYFSRRERRGH